jgi:diketogulonate reductase-like aldo/keto reductase
MFGFGRSWKSSKFEAAANQYFLNKYGISVEIVGYLKLSEITYEIYNKLDRENRLVADEYIVELENKFRSLGFIP